jgi:hypothetical protein
MIISIINCLMFAFCFAASRNNTMLDVILRITLFSLAIYNGFEAYRFYVMGA